MLGAERNAADDDSRRALFQGSTLKQAAFDGDIGGGKVEAGQTAGLISDIKPAADVMRDIVADYVATLRRLPQPRS